MRGERVDPRRRERLPGGAQIAVHGDRREVVVVQAGAAQLGFGQIESQRLDKMQFASRRGDHADRIAGVGRDAWREEHQPEHNAVSSRTGKSQVTPRRDDYSSGVLTSASSCSSAAAASSAAALASRPAGLATEAPGLVAVA